MFKKSIFVLFFSVILIVLVFCTNTNTTPPLTETVVNGVNIANLSESEAKDFFNNYINTKANEITLDIKYKEKVWSFNGSSFIANSKIHSVLDDLYSYTKNGDYSKKIKTLQQIKKMGFDNYIALDFTFRGIEEKIDGIISEIEQEAISSTISFNPQNESFKITPCQIGIKVDREKLVADIISLLQQTKNVEVEVSTTDIIPQFTEENLKGCTKKQASFSTSFTTSSKERKHNIALAAQTLNGIRINPLQIFSFNDIIGVRNEEKGYKTAKIIKNGEFVDGVGGGICQVSTTLYNALLLAGVQTTEVHRHSLPVSYVPPSLDAMVSWGSSDLKFKNITDFPIFISAKCNGNSISFSIYGATKPDDVTIKTRSEIVGKIKHGGDKILKDSEKKYIDKIMFKGEFLRVKNGKDGYESRAFLDYYKNGKLIDQKQIRSDRYEAQCGIVYEGTEDLIEGFTLPDDCIPQISLPLEQTN